MRENSVIKKRILQYLDFKGVSKYEFYQKTGVSNGVLSQNNGLSEDNIMKFLSYYRDINVNWLVTGEGEMLKSEGPAPVPSPPPDLMLAQRDIIDLQKDKIKLLEQALQDQKQQVEALKKELAHCHSLAMRPGSVR